MTIQQAAKDMEDRMTAELESRVHTGDPLPKPKKARPTRNSRKARLVVENTNRGDGSTIELASFNLKGDANLAAQAIESALIKTGQVVKRNHCLFPAKRRSVRTKHAKEHSDA